jgi:hypothetical protein
MLRGYSKREGSSTGCHYWAGQLPYSSMQHSPPTKCEASSRATSHRSTVRACGITQHAVRDPTLPRFLSMCSYLGSIQRPQDLHPSALTAALRGLLRYQCCEATRKGRVPALDATTGPVSSHIVVCNSSWRTFATRHCWMLGLYWSYWNAFEWDIQSSFLLISRKGGVSWGPHQL